MNSTGERPRPTRAAPPSIPESSSPAPRSSRPKPRPAPEQPSGNDVKSALIYAGLVMGVMVTGVLGWLFASETETVVAAPVVTTAAPTTTVAPTTTSTSTAPTTSTTTSTSTTTTTTIPIAVADLQLARIGSVTGNISPKSVTATPSGLFFAQNMMYRHTITVYDAQGTLLKTIDDRVDLAEFGVEDGVVAQGAPVEAASTSDGRYVYVSNYAMYGPGFGEEPGDGCADAGWDNSFVYRVDTETLEIDQVIEVGAVPKFLAVSPDDKYVLVANWCSYDLSIVDTALGAEIARIDIGRHPRGVAISSDSSTAYVTEMGGSDIAIVPLDKVTRSEHYIRHPGAVPGLGPVPDIELDWIADVGRGPRSIVLSPDDRYLYATLNGDGRVVKIDLSSGEIIASVRTGDAPRSMAISGDGEALYVVNYASGTMSKVLVDDMNEIQEVRTADKPIGITVDPNSPNVWVSNYSGVLQIFEEQ